MLALECGSQFTLYDGNNSTLVQAWGWRSEDWIGQELELVLGTYKDWKTDPPADKETVKVRAISPAKTAAQNGGAPAKKPLPPSKRVAPQPDGLDDEIPF